MAQVPHTGGTSTSRTHVEPFMMGNHFVLGFHRELNGILMSERYLFLYICQHIRVLQLQKDALILLFTVNSLFIVHLQLLF